MVTRGGVAGRAISEIARPTRRSFAQREPRWPQGGRGWASDHSPRRKSLARQKSFSIKHFVCAGRMGDRFSMFSHNNKSRLYESIYTINMGTKVHIGTTPKIVRPLGRSPSALPSPPRAENPARKTARFTSRGGVE